MKSENQKYVIGLCPFDRDIEVVVVEAENELVAMAKSIFAFSSVSLGTHEEWDLDKNLKNLPYKTVEEGVDFFLQGDVNISKPLLLSEL